MSIKHEIVAVKNYKLKKCDQPVALFYKLRVQRNFAPYAINFFIAQSFLPRFLSIWAKRGTFFSAGRSMVSRAA